MNLSNKEYTPGITIHVISGLTMVVISLAAFSQSGNNGEQIDKAFAVGATLLFCVAALIVLFVITYRQYFLGSNSFTVTDFWGRTKTEVKYEEIYKVLDRKLSGNVIVTILKKNEETIELNLSSIDESKELIRTLRERVSIY